MTGRPRHQEPELVRCQKCGCEVLSVKLLDGTEVPCFECYWEEEERDQTDPGSVK
jgi:hypothetical protein